MYDLGDMHVFARTFIVRDETAVPGWVDDGRRGGGSKGLVGDEGLGEDLARGEREIPQVERLDSRITHGVCGCQMAAGIVETWEQNVCQDDHWS